MLISGLSPTSEEIGTAPVGFGCALGGERVLDELLDDPLPRIC